MNKVDTEGQESSITSTTHNLNTVKSFDFEEIFFFLGQTVLKVFAKVKICDKSRESQHLLTHSKQSQTQTHN